MKRVADDKERDKRISKAERICLIAGMVLIAISIILGVMTIRKRQELDELNTYKEELQREIDAYGDESIVHDQDRQ